MFADKDEALAWLREELWKLCRRRVPVVEGRPALSQGLAKHASERHGRGPLREFAARCMAA